MEEAEKTQPFTQNGSQQPPKKKINIWKIFSIILFIAFVGLGAYLLGKNQIAPNKTSPVQTAAKNSVPTKVISVSPTIISSPTTTDTKITAGINNQFFSVYTITVPSGWVTSKKELALTITKGQNNITISQAAAGAGSCNYPGDTPEAMAQTFTGFVGITGKSSQFRRGSGAGSNGYTVCELKTGGYAFPTSYGYITYTLSNPGDQTTLAEMDGMLASLTK